MARYRKINDTDWVQTSGDAYIPKYTLAEYERIKDTIPVGTEFIIVDDYSASGDIYSEEEQVIGRWIDGKPLYQKSFTYSGQLTIAGTLIGNIKNFKELCGCDLVARNSSNIRWSNYTSKDDTANMWVEILVSNGNVSIFVKETWSSPIVHCTLKYTKTTD